MRVVLALIVLSSFSLVSAQEGDAKNPQRGKRIRPTVPEADTRLDWVDDWTSEEWRKRHEEEDRRAREVHAAMRNMMMGVRFEKRDVPVVRFAPQRGLSVRFMRPFRSGVFLTAHQRGVRRNHVVTEPYYVDLATGDIIPRPLIDRARGLYYAADDEFRNMKPRKDFYTPGYYLDLRDRRIHRIRVEEVNDVHAAVVAGERAWFAGLTNGKPVLVGIGEEDRITVPLPQEDDEIPDLGLDGQCLLAVYSKTIYRLTDRQWSLVHSGNILLPRSGLPPQRYGNMVLLRDEERTGPYTHKYLWYLITGEKSSLSPIGSDTGLFEPLIWSDPQCTMIQFPGSPNWGDTSSYCVTSGGDLWACVGHGSFLIRRSTDGRYSIAIGNNSVRFREEPISYWEADLGLRVSAVAALPDDSLLLAGLTGLYWLKDNELAQELAFAYEEAVDSSGRNARHWGWDLANVLPLDNRAYVIGSDSRGGVYLLREDDDGQWSAQATEEGDPIVW